MNVRLLKIIGGVALGFLLALAGGWMWGASGRSELRSHLDEMTLRAEISDARARLLAARVDLYSLNFGAATGNLEGAKVPLANVMHRYERDGETERVKDAQAAIDATENARRLAAKLDQSAQGIAASALATLERATRPPGK